MLTPSEFQHSIFQLFKCFRLWRIRLFLFLLLAFPAELSAKSEIDSLIQKLALTDDDRSRIKILLSIAWEIQYSDPDSSIAICNRVIEKSKELNFPEGEANAWNNMGFTCYIKGDFDQGLAMHYKSLRIRQNINHKLGVAASYGNIGIYYDHKGNLKKALHYYFKVLHIFYELRDLVRVSTAINNIGNIYVKLGNYPKALKFYLVELSLDERLHDLRGIATSLHNVGLIYDNMDDKNRSIEYYNKSFAAYKKINDLDGMAASLSNSGSVYLVHDGIDTAELLFNQALEYMLTIDKKAGLATVYNNLAYIYLTRNRYDTAIYLCQKGLSIRIEIGDHKGMVNSYNKLGNIYFKMKDYPKALLNLHHALSMATDQKYLRSLQEAYGILYQIYDDLNKSKTGRSDSLIKNAYYYFKKYTAYSDSLKNEEKTKSIARIETRFEYEKKMALQKVDFEKDQLLSKEESRRQKIIIVSVIVILTCVSAFGFYIFTRYRIIRFQKKLIEVQKKNLETANKEINEAKKIIEEKNKDITDSIRYASRIQRSILVPEKIIKEYIPGSFFFYKPKDIVSGDFYFFAIVNQYALIAAVDCTGHGVPGAFMSIIGNDVLNQIVNDKKTETAAQVLTELDKRVMSILHPKGTASDVKDGMDISFLALQFKLPLSIPPIGGKGGCNIENHYLKVQFSGAKRPMLFIRKGEVTEYDGDKNTIGGHAVEGKMFTNHAIDLQPGDSIYLYTDGFGDQFGGTKEKKFKEKNLRELLLEIHAKPMDEQRRILEEEFEKWRGVNEQTDDVTVIGIKI